MSSGHRTATIGCCVASHLPLALQKLSDPSYQPIRTHRAANRRPKMAPFSRENLYNQNTTVQPVICQFRKNSLLTSHVMKVLYKKVKIWRRIISPMLGQLSQTKSGCKRRQRKPGLITCWEMLSASIVSKSASRGIL